MAKQSKSKNKKQVKKQKLEVVKRETVRPTPPEPKKVGKVTLYSLYKRQLEKNDDLFLKLNKLNVECFEDSLGFIAYTQKKREKILAEFMNASEKEKKSRFEMIFTDYRSMLELYNLATE